MQRNIGPRNRFEPGVVGLVALLIAFTSVSWLVFTIMLFLGSIMMGEAFSGHCIYRKTKDMR